MSEPFDIQRFIRELTEQSGVYRMINKKDEVIYVGKAKNLKKRVNSYFKQGESSIKTQVMVKQVTRIEVTTTHTETEALLLENNLIKQLKPRYNVVFRDDKSYPYVFLSKGMFPKLAYHRGQRRFEGEYFGPFPSALAVKKSLSLLQKLFKVRQCEDSVFRHRTRPCLQYQIKRCKAPCVGYIDQEDYAKDVELTRLFYHGKNEEVIEQLKQQMDDAASELNYEAAATYRDLISDCRKLIEKQVISQGEIDADIMAFSVTAGMATAMVLFVRKGNVTGSHAYFPRFPKHTPLDELINAFVLQFYLAKKTIPQEIILSHPVEDVTLLQNSLAKLSSQRIKLSTSVRSPRADWLTMAKRNLEQAVSARMIQQTGAEERLNALQQALSFENRIERMECFDISHTMGEGTVASCVTFVQGVPERSAYRRFNIEGETAGDDYAAIKQAVSRRYTRLLKESMELPELIIIDGGVGQLNKARDVMLELGLPVEKMIAISKGSDRKAGMEKILFGHPVQTKIFPETSPELHLLQHIRDEAHRFAIAGHRHKRSKTRQSSWLEQIQGVGSHKRRMLLRHFGGLQEIERAGIDDLMQVKGISRHLAEKIYAFVRD